MKACHLTSVHAHDDVRILVKECASLAAAGIDTHLVAAGVTDQILRGVHIHGVPRGGKGRWRRATLTVWRVYRKAREVDADVYHFHDPELIPVGLALHWAGKKVVYDAHEDFPRQILYKRYLPAIVRKPAAWLAETLENFACRRFDCVVAATPIIRDRFLQKGCRSVDILNFPILSEFLRPAASDGSAKAPCVCYVGNITRERGIREMVSSLSGLDVKLLLAGKFESDALRKEIESLPEWGQVEYLGHVSREGVSRLLARSMAGLVVLHPVQNYLDGYPIKMFEYMAAGIPVIASDFPLWKTLIQDVDCALFADPLDPRDVGKAIRWIREHPGEAQAMGARGQGAVEIEFNWDVQEKKLLECYHRLKKNGHVR